jgi:hypothetical protein
MLVGAKEKDPFPKARVARERVQMSLRAGLTAARACPVRTGLYRLLAGKL